MADKQRLYGTQKYIISFRICGTYLYTKCQKIAHKVLFIQTSVTVYEYVEAPTPAKNVGADSINFERCWKTSIGATPSAMTSAPFVDQTTSTNLS